VKLNKLAMALVGCTALTAYAADLKVTSSDLDHARLYLNQTQTPVIGATKGLSKAQWEFKPAPDRWSIAEIVEHIVLAQELILGPIRERLAASPPAPERETKLVDAAVINQIPDRTSIFKAPEPLEPTGRWTPAASMERMQKNYARLIEYLETAPDLRQHLIEAAPLKAVSKGAYDSMDGYQWILTAAAHTERHTKQILEVRADADFPAK
jgi:hypothetical protein